MKLAIKFALIILLGTCIVQGIASVLRVQREIALFRSDIARDQQTMGHDLAAAVATIWTLAGAEAADRFVNDANESKSHMRIQWTPRDRAGDVAAGDEATPDRLRTSIDVIADGNTIGTLSLSETLDEERQYIIHTVRRTLVRTGVFMLLTGAAMLLLGLVYVGRPVRRLVEQARKIAGGDFSSRLSLRQRDELATLAQEMNRMAEQLDATHQKLRKEMAERLAVLEQLRHADRLMTVGQLTSGIAHEMGTPLNLILAHGRMIATGEVEGPETAQSARIVIEQSERITSAIRRLLDYARRPRPRRVRTDLTRVISEVITLLRPVAARRGVVMELQTPGAPLVTIVDVEQIQQVLTNVLLNAMQAMPRGGRVDLSLAECRNGSDSSAVRIEVRDTGEGIREEHLGRVFDPFFTTKGADGTGLGLSIASEIIHDHGGSIEMQSTFGVGTSVSIVLPGDRGDEP